MSTCPNPGEIRVASWFTSESSSNRPQTRPMGEEHFLLAAAQVILGGFSSRGINSWKGRKISSGQTVGQTWDWCWWRSSIPFFPAALNIFQLAPHWLFQFLAREFFWITFKIGQKTSSPTSKNPAFPLAVFFYGSLPSGFYQKPV